MCPVFIHWRRKGWLVPVVGLGTPAGLQLLVDGAYGMGTYSSHARALAPVGLLLAAGILAAVDGRLLRRPRPQQAADSVMIEYPDRPPPSDGSAFLFVPVRWWVVALVGFAVLAALIG